MTSQVFVPLIIASCVALLAGIVDVIRFRVPNLITVPFVVSGLGYHGAIGGLQGLRYSAGGCLTCFFIVLILYLIGAMGAGDVKFTAGVGAWLGAELAVCVFIIAALATGLYSVALLVWQGGLAKAAVAVDVVLCQMYRFKVLAKHLSGVQSIEAVAKSQECRQRLVPFAAMMAGAVLAIDLWKWIFPN